MINAQIVESPGLIKSLKVVILSGDRFIGETSVISSPSGNALITLILPLLRKFEA